MIWYKERYTVKKWSYMDRTYKPLIVYGWYWKYLLRKIKIKKDA